MARVAHLLFRGIGLMVIIGVGGMWSCGYLVSRQAMDGPQLVDGDVVFRFFAPTARRVQLAGDWPGNNWARGDGSVGEANIGLMADDDADGVWELAVTLGPGRYRYLFWVDETLWQIDPGNPDEVDGGPARRCSQIVVHINDNRLELR